MKKYFLLLAVILIITISCTMEQKKKLKDFESETIGINR